MLKIQVSNAHNRLCNRLYCYYLVAKYGRPGGKKVNVPKMDEKPIMGLVSDKNFIVSNAVENILAAPQMAGNTDKDYLKKNNYGRVPKYL